MKNNAVSVIDDDLPDMFADLPSQDPFEVKRDHVAVDLAALLVYSGKSRTQAAQILNWPKSRVTTFLSGKGNPTVKSIYEFCSKLGFDFDLVFRLPNELPKVQPWECAHTAVLDAVSVTLPHPDFVLKVQTAEQVVDDYLVGAGKSVYLSVCDLSQPEVSLPEAVAEPKLGWKPVSNLMFDQPSSQMIEIIR